MATLLLPAWLHWPNGPLQHPTKARWRCLLRLGELMEFANYPVSVGLFEALAGGETRLGPLTLAGKRYFAENLHEHQGVWEEEMEFLSIFEEQWGDYDQEAALDGLDAYTLFGDPALRLQLPSPDLEISLTTHPAGPLAPGDAVTITLHYSNTGLITATQVAITSSLPDAFVDVQVSGDPPLANLRWPLRAQMLIISGRLANWLPARAALSPSLPRSTPLSTPGRNSIFRPASAARARRPGN